MNTQVTGSFDHQCNEGVRLRLIRLVRAAITAPLASIDARQSAEALAAVRECCHNLQAEEGAQITWASFCGTDDLASLAQALEVEGTPDPAAACQAALRQSGQALRKSGGCAILVIEHANLADDQAAAFIAALPATLPANVHVALLQDGASSLPLSRLLAKGLVRTVNAADFTYDAQELASFVSQSIGQSPSEDDVCALGALTQGRGDALRIACEALSEAGGLVRGMAMLQDGSSPFVQQVVAEALSFEPERTRALLLAAGLARTCTTAQLAALLGEGATTQEALQALESDAGTLLFCRQRGARFTCVPLFACALRMLAREDAAFDAAQATERLLQGLLLDRNHAQFVDSLFDLQCWQAAQTCLGDAADDELYLLFSAAREGGLFQPDALEARSHAHDAVLFVLAAIRLMSGDRAQDAQLALDCAADLLQPGAPRRTLLRPWVEMLQAACLGLQGKATEGDAQLRRVSSDVGESALFACWHAEAQGLVHANGDQPYLAAEQFIAAQTQAEQLRDGTLALAMKVHLAQLYLAQGKLARAQSCAQEALRACAGNPAFDLHRHQLLLVLAHVQCHRCEFQPAQEQVGACAAFFLTASRPTDYLQACLLQAQISADQGLYEQARSQLMAARSYANQARCDQLALDVDRQLACVRLHTDEDELVQRWFDDAQADTFDNRLSWARHYLARTRILLAHGKPYEALQLVDEVTAKLRESRFNELLTQALVVQAITLRQLSGKKADRSLDEALQLALPEQDLLPFALLKQQLSGLFAFLQLAETAQGQGTTATQEFFAQVPALDGADAPARSERTGADAQPLTRRESEVCQLLLGKLSYQDIGKQLGISKNTVHAHCGNIYAKLGVTDRSQLEARYVQSME